VSTRFTRFTREMIIACKRLQHAALIVSAALLYPSSDGAGQIAGAGAGAYDGPVFEDVTRARGLTVSHISTLDKRYIIESMSGGAGFIDCDHDGRLDIVMVGGSTVERYRRGGDPMVTLYRQQRDGTFTDSTARAGLTRRGWGMGVATADFDNDGHLDLYVTGYGGNVLYRNLGDCRFADVTESAGVRAGGFSTGAAWADYDRDGRVDLFVSRYVHVDIDRLPAFGRDKTCVYRGIPVQCGPWGLPGEGDTLFHNRGDGTFEDVSARAGVADAAGRYGMGVVWGDYDNDQWPDLFVANDAGENYLYHNNHDGTFSDVAMSLGVALNADGVPVGNMGVDFGDFDRDGRLDIFDTTFENQDDILYQNRGSQGFVDISRAAGVGQASVRLVKWGTSFVDFDNDGWLDLFVASGHVLPQVDQSKEGYTFKQPLLLHMNTGHGTFVDASAPAGLPRVAPAARRGAAFGDVDNDGAMDVVIVNIGEPPTLLRNHLANDRHWIGFDLVGTTSNRAAIGAQVTVRAGSLVQSDYVRGGGSYLSQNDLRLHFGLGRQTAVDAVEVLWPNGQTERLTDLAVDRFHRITQGPS
jgi:hypothetical protein